MLRAMLTTVAAFCLLLAATSVGAAEAGKVVSLEGTVEIGRAGVFTAALPGSIVETGDTVRTGKPGRARLLFLDDSVLNVGDGSTLVIDESVFDPGKGAATTMMHLLGGKVRALVSEYYKGAAASYQIETPTAVAGVRGTEFVVAYDEGATMTEVYGLGGEVAVHSVRDRRNHGVLIRANELTEVAKGKYPTAPRQIARDDDYILGLLDGLDLPGGGLPESLLLDDPAFGPGKQATAPGQADSAKYGVPTPDTADSNTYNVPGQDGTDTPLADLPPTKPAVTGGDLLDQPQPVLEAPTDIDIRF